MRLQNIAGLYLPHAFWSYNSGKVTRIFHFSRGAPFHFVFIARACMRTCTLTYNHIIIIIIIIAHTDGNETSFYIMPPENVFSLLQVNEMNEKSDPSHRRSEHRPVCT